MDLIEQLRAAGKGTEEWRVADPADGSYCISFSWASSINPEREAREWLEDHRKRFPDGMHAHYEVRRVVAQNDADLTMCQAADEIDRLRKICMTAKEALYAGTKDDFEVADMLEAAFLTPNAIVRGGSDEK